MRSLDVLRADRRPSFEQKAASDNGAVLAERQEKQAA